jgi:hypothetical protein
MSVRTIHRLCFSDNADMCSKGLREIVRQLGTDSVTSELPADYAQMRAELAEKGTEELLLKLSSSDDAVHRELSVAALGAWQGDAARDVIIAATEDAEDMVRATAIGALEAWPESENGYEILLVAIDDAKWPVRMQAARALRTFPGKDADEALLNTLLDPNADVRFTASFSLFNRDHAVILPQLRELFDHPAPHLFDAGLDLLGDIGTAEDAKFLGRVGSLFNFSQPGHVRKWARDAARKIKARQRANASANGS